MINSRIKLEEKDKHMLEWLNGTGMVISHWGTGFPEDFEGLEAPAGSDLFDFYNDPQTISTREAERLSDNTFPLDMLPLCVPDLNTLPIALYLGCEPDFASTNIWYRHTDISAENDRALIIDKENQWLKNHLEIYRHISSRLSDQYYIGMPALVTNLDVLVELRGAENLMMDLIMYPDWVKAKLDELHQAFLDTYPLFLPYCTDEKNWSTQAYFMFRGPGKVGLSHCDTASMISVDMFSEFVIPYVRRQCEYLDYTLYHVDGPAAVASVDPLLEVEGLTALEFTPGPQVPDGGDPCWYDMYKKIKAAGKGVQAVGIKPAEVKPLLDSVGPEGMYLMIDFQTEKEIETIAKIADGYR